MSDARPGTSLRTRISLAFGLGALLLTALFAVVTLALTRQLLVDARENGARQIAINNAIRVKARLGPDVDLTAILANLSTTEGSRPLVRLGDVTEGSNVQEFGPDDIPTDVSSQVSDGAAATMKVRLDGVPTLVIGVPIPGFDADYYEAVSLSETESTLRTLSFILVGGTLGITALGAVLGQWASRRTLIPLYSVSNAAEAIAGGRLDTRLEPPADAELASFASSFNDMAGALEERIQRDARFASEVSHELRSPLMTLAASVEVLENHRSTMPERASTALDLLSDDVQRFQQLVEDLLEISKFDVGTASLELDAVQAVEFVRQATQVMSRDPVPVVYDRQVEEAIIMADKRRLAQVMQNLIDNARKYADGATRIEVTGSETSIQIAVEDGGPGVPVAERDVIFDRFSRGGAGGRRGSDTGVGLGLSLVAEHVRLHDGRVWVEDRLDGAPGARFVVELPRDLQVAQ